MQRTTLGPDGPSVSVLCLGTMTWGTQNTVAEAHAQIDMAAEHGVNFMDTAEMYPVNPVRAETVGNTERIIGEWLAKGGRRGDWVIATKIAGQGGAARGGEPITGDSIARALDASLTRLRTDYTDLYQLHWPNRGSYHFRQWWSFRPSAQDKAATLRNIEDCLGEIGRQIAAGKVRHWGLSNESAWGMAQWLRLADAMGVPRPVSVQNEYSLLCRIYDGDMAELGHNERVTLLAFSPLATGLLTGKYAPDVTPPGSRRTLNADLSGRITPRVWGAVGAYARIAADAGLDLTQMAIAWTLTRPFPAIPIFGATTPDQLRTALGSAAVTLPRDVLDAIDAAQRAHPMPF
jgi:aryl-alcohol dehydrogenase-like predicted oxidoreductase